MKIKKINKQIKIKIIIFNKLNNIIQTIKIRIFFCILLKINLNHLLIHIFYKFIIF
jgi:hypothetical protein